MGFDLQNRILDADASWPGRHVRAQLDAPAADRAAIKNVIGKEQAFLVSIEHANDYVGVGRFGGRNHLNCFEPVHRSLRAIMRAFLIAMRAFWIAIIRGAPATSIISA